MFQQLLKRLFVASLFVTPAFAQDAYLKAVNPDTQDSWGQDLATDGDTLVVGGHRAGAFGEGAVTVFVRNGASWDVQQTISPPGGNSQDLFGSAVSMHGDTLAVGAPGHGDLASQTPFEGAVYVYVRSGTTWTFEALLTSPVPTILGNLGASVSISGDTIVGGAIGEGAAHVYVRSGTSWSLEDSLAASNYEAGDFYGYSVGISDDTMVVGAPFEDGGSDGLGGNQNDNSAPLAGAAYVYVRSGSIWAQQEYLKASVSDPTDQFGWSASISGETIVVGAPFEQSTATGIGGNASDNGFPGAGAVYAFVRSGSAWTQEAYIKASNTGFADQFGFAVGLSGDELVVGAPTEESAAIGVDGDQSDNNSAQSGAAYTFSRAGATWSQGSYLKASNTGIQDTFGLGVAIANGTALIGSPGEDSDGSGLGDNSAPDSGAAFVYDLDGGPGGGGGTASFRNGGSNPASYSVTVPQLGTTMTGSVDLVGTTGHTSAALLGYASPLNFPLAGGQVLLVNPTDPAGELLSQPLVAGPSALFPIALPNNVALVGYSLSTQAIHIGGVTPFALSNAQDLVLDF